MTTKDLIKKTWYKISYAVIVIIYLFCLDNLNNNLLAQNFASSFDLLIYNDYCALKYFGIASLLFLFGCIIIYTDISYFRKGLEYCGEIIIAIGSIVVILFLLVLIICYISIPILKAVLTCVLVVIGALSMSAD